MISKTKHDDRSLHAFHHLKGFPNACRLDGKSHDDGDWFLVYVGANISFDSSI